MSDLDRSREFKLWLAVRVDLAMPAGKLAAQAGHGFVSVAMLAQHMRPDAWRIYLLDDQPKIVVQVPSASALRRVRSEALDASIPSAIITDAGRTVFSEPTETVCAFGPCRLQDLPPFLRRLRLL